MINKRAAGNPSKVVIMNSTALKLQEIFIKYPEFEKIDCLNSYHILHTTCSSS